MDRPSNHDRVPPDAACEWADWGDVTWARKDAPTQPMVVNIMLLLAAPLDRDRVQALFAQRLRVFARFRQRLVKRGLRYAWVEDPAFAMSRHLEWRRLPDAGDQRALPALVGELARGTLDPDRPLWRCVVVENIGTGCALVFRVHHCIADGIALLRVFLTLADRVRESGYGVRGSECTDDAAQAAMLEERRILSSGNGWAGSRLRRKRW